VEISVAAQTTSDYAEWPSDWWDIPTQGFPGSHYATWPEALCVRPILAMCPQHVCTTCGEPRRRIVQPTEWDHREHPLEREGIQRGGLGTHGDRVATPTTLGWSDCGHGTYRRGIVLDPFAGSGTTLAVAEGHGRDSIGIDLDSRNEHLIRERVGMWLEVA
jgi:site-specific DNA-methyltransferase (adenine-specific)